MAAEDAGDITGRWWKVFAYNATTGAFTTYNTLQTGSPAPYTSKEVEPQSK